MSVGNLEKNMDLNMFWNQENKLLKLIFFK